MSRTHKQYVSKYGRAWYTFYGDTDLNCTKCKRCCRDGVEAKYHFCGLSNRSLELYSTYTLLKAWFGKEKSCFYKECVRELWLRVRSFFTPVDRWRYGK